MLTQILIVAAREEFSVALERELSREYSVMSCCDQAQALELIRIHQPKLLIVDMMIPGVDALTLLSRARAAGCTSRLLAISRYYSDYTLQALGGLRASYLAIKPCPLDAVTDRVEDLLAEQTVLSVRGEIGQLLVELSLKAGRKGFRYCRKAIELLVRDPGQQLTKEVYPAVAKMFGTDVRSVEKDIRDVIDAAWHTGDMSVWRRYFPTAADGTVVHPGNRDFLCRLAEVIAAQTLRVI